MQPLAHKLSAQQLQSDAVFEYISEQLKLDPSKAQTVNGVFLCVITKDGKQAKQWSKYSQDRPFFDILSCSAEINTKISNQSLSIANLCHEKR